MEKYPTQNGPRFYGEKLFMLSHHISNVEISCYGSQPQKSTDVSSNFVHLFLVTSFFQFALATIGGFLNMTDVTKGGASLYQKINMNMQEDVGEINLEDYGDVVFWVCE